MAFNVRFLLISGAHSLHWHKALRSALTPLGVLDVVDQQGAVESILASEYDLVFIDATVVADVPRLVREIRGHRRALPIIVASASADWAQAREVYRAGATDHIRKSQGAEELRLAVRAALRLPPASEV